MLAQPDPPKESVFKNPLLYSWAALAFVALVVVSILLSRWMENHNFEQRAKQAKIQQQREQDSVALEQMGGKELAIQNFYATPGIIAAAKRSSYAMASPTPKPSSSSRSPIPSGLLTPAVLT